MFDTSEGDPLTVPAEIPFTTFAGDGTTTTFVVPFTWTESADVVASYTVAGAPVAAGYSITGTSGNSYVVFNTAPPAGAVGLIQRNTPVAQLQSAPFASGGAFPNQALALGLDQLTRVAAEQAAELGTALKVPLGDTPPPIDLTGMIDGQVIGQAGGKLGPVTGPSSITVTGYLLHRALVMTQTIVSAVTTIQTSGYYAAGDGGGATYVRGAGPYSDGSSFQTADGAWWQLQGMAVYPEMFGARADGATNDTAAIQAAIAFVSRSSAIAGRVTLRHGRTYRITSQMVVNGQVGFVLTSEGGSGRLQVTGGFTTGQTVLLVQNCFQCEFSVNISNSSTTLLCALELQNTGTNTWIGAPMAECVVRDCTFGIGVGGTQWTIGVRITDTRCLIGTNDNNSEHKFQRVHVLQATQAGWSFETLNALQIDLDRCETSNVYNWPSNFHSIQTVSIIATSGANAGTDRGGGGFVARHCMFEGGGGLNAPVIGTGNCHVYLRGTLLHDILLIGCEGEDNSALLDVNISTSTDSGVIQVNFTSCCMNGGVGDFPTTAGSFIVGNTYQIYSPGTTNFTTIGAASNAIGTVFTATGVGSGTGTATHYVPYINANTATRRLILNFVNCDANAGRGSAMINLNTSAITMNWIGGMFTATNVTGNGNLNISCAASVIGTNGANFAASINLTCMMFNETFQVGGVAGFNGMPFYIATDAFINATLHLVKPGGTLNLENTAGTGSVGIQVQTNGGGTGIDVLQANARTMLVSDGVIHSTANGGATSPPAGSSGFLQFPGGGGMRSIAVYPV